MNTMQLICFLTVAETLNFARAAEQLHVTQPAVTQQIHSRIKEAGVSLQALNIYYSDQLSTVRNFISHDIAAGFLYRPIAETMPEVKSGSLSPPLITRISLIWKSGYENYPHIKLFINYILNNIQK